MRSIACEAAAIGITGGLLGAVAGSVFHAVVVRRVRRVRELTLLHVHYAFSPSTVALAIISGMAIALIGAFLPARRAARLDLLNALNG